MRTYRKNYWKSVETVYQDAVSAQNRFRSARENLAATELSFELTQEQFFLKAKKYGRIDDGEKQLAGCPARVDTSQIYGDPESAIVEFLSGYRDQYPMIEVCENQVIV